MKYIALSLLSLLSLASAQQPLFSGGQNCVACLGTKRIICQTVNNGTGCFDSLAACPQDQWRTNIFTQCSSVSPNVNNIIRSTDQNCQRNRLMNLTTGQNTSEIFSHTVSLGGN